MLKRSLTVLLTALSLWPGLAQTKSETIKFLPLGDSITDGDGKHDSYRRHLWHLLRSAGFQIDFIGSKHLNGYHDEPPPHPDFDLDHEGHSGWTAQDILTGPTGWDQQRGKLHDWLTLNMPDVVLLHIGTNDILHCESIDAIIVAVENIVGQIKTRCPNAFILVAEIIPIGDPQSLGFEDTYCASHKHLGETVNEFNSRIKTHFKNTRGVYTVDIHSGFDAQAHLRDGIHPNAIGEEKIAGAWFAAIEGVLPQPGKHK